MNGHPISPLSFTHHSHAVHMYIWECTKSCQSTYILNKATHSIHWASKPGMVRKAFRHFLRHKWLHWSELQEDVSIRVVQNLLKLFCNTLHIALLCFSFTTFSFTYCLSNLLRQ